MNYIIFTSWVKKIIKPIFFKWHRLLYFFKYRIPIFDRRVDSTRFVNFLEVVDQKIESAAIIGKGASIFESNPLSEIQKCDFKFLMNSVDVNHLKPYIGNKFDAQITSHVGRVDSLMPVLSGRDIKKLGIKTLICNNNLKHRNGETVKDYWNFFNNRVHVISYMPLPEEFSFYPEMSNYGERLTIASSVLLLLYNISSIKKIVFVGVDAFHFGYSDGSNLESKHFYSMYYGGYDDPRSSHGIPFLKFLFDTLEKINQLRIVEAYFPKILREHIDFPDRDYIKFYQ